MKSSGDNKSVNYICKMYSFSQALEENSSFYCYFEGSSSGRSSTFSPESTSCGEKMDDFHLSGTKQTTQIFRFPSLSHQEGDTAF